MEWSLIAEKLSEYGLIGVMLAVVVYVLWSQMDKRDTDNKQRIEELKDLNDKRVDDLKSEIAIVREESKEERELYKESVEAFRQSNNGISMISAKIDNLEIDVNYIKNNINK